MIIADHLCTVVVGIAGMEDKKKVGRPAGSFSSTRNRQQHRAGSGSRSSIWCSRAPA
jgi:hypothetical protein